MSEELQKHTLNLTPGAYEKLQGFYPDVGAAPIIRRLVDKWIERIEAHGVAEINANIEVKI